MEFSISRDTEYRETFKSERNYAFRNCGPTSMGFYIFHNGTTTRQPNIIIQVSSELLGIMYEVGCTSKNYIVATCLNLR